MWIHSVPTKVKVCMDVRGTTQAYDSMSSHSHRRTLVANPFFCGVAGAKSLSGSYLHPFV
jgi:hypothetical protein